MGRLLDAFVLRAEFAKVILFTSSICESDVFIPLNNINLLRQLNKRFIIDDETIYHVLYLGNLKLYTKSEDDMVSLVNTVRILSTDI